MSVLPEPCCVSRPSHLARAGSWGLAAVIVLCAVVCPPALAGTASNVYGSDNYAAGQGYITNSLYYAYANQAHSTYQSGYTVCAQLLDALYHDAGGPANCYVNNAVKGGNALSPLHGFFYAGNHGLAMYGKLYWCIGGPAPC